VFAMMEQDYTTRSSPEYVDGWLGLMVGDQLWNGMWAEDQVAAVAAAITGAVDVASAAATKAGAASSAANPAASLPRPIPASPAVAAAPACTAPPPPSSPLLKRPADPLTPANKSARVPPPAAPAAASAADESPRPQPARPALTQAMSPHVAEGGEEELSEALSAAFECLRDANKARDSAALADLLLGLGVACDVDLAYVDDADCLSLRALLKPAAANSFASNMKTIAAIMKARSMCSDAKHEAAARDYTAACFEYLQQASKHSDAAAMAALLHQLGVTQARELQYLDDAQVRGCVALFKPVAARVFVHMMRLVKRGW
jgi:hypothetical protein